MRVAEGGSDIYAIRAPRTDWPSLRAALLADGRLTISEREGTWTIALDPANRAMEKQALAQYEESVRSQLHDLCAPATQQAKDWFSLSTDQYLAVKSALVKAQGGTSKPPENRADLVVALALDARDDRDYGRIAIPTALSAPGTHLGDVWRADATQAAPLLAPNGDALSNFVVNGTYDSYGEPRPREENLARLREASFAGKLVWDPLTLTTGLRWGFWTPALAQDLKGIAAEGQARRITPKWYLADTSIPLEMPKISWRPAAPGHNPAWEAEAAMPLRAVSVSEATLLWAEEKDANLVAYVSPLGDLPLAAKPSRSLEDAVRDLDAGTLDRMGIGGLVTKWVGEEGGYPFMRVTSLPPMRRAILLQAGGFTVLRTESPVPRWSHRRGAERPGELAQRTPQGGADSVQGGRALCGGPPPDTLAQRPVRRRDARLVRPCLVLSLGRPPR